MIYNLHYRNITDLNTDSILFWYSYNISPVMVGTPKSHLLLIIWALLPLWDIKFKAEPVM